MLLEINGTESSAHASTPGKEEELGDQSRCLHERGQGIFLAFLHKRSFYDLYKVFIEGATGRVTSVPSRFIFSVAKFIVPDRRI
jgi:hypothetical protein